MPKQYYVYILAHSPYGALYVGVTNNLLRRMWEHKRVRNPKAHTAKYHIHTLVWYETHTDIHEAIAHEKKLKKWKRQWKFDLIESQNPEWQDLYAGLL